MADATVAMNVNPYPKGLDTTVNRTIIYGQATITANGGTSPATGLPLSWTAMGDGTFNNAKPFVLPVGPLKTQPEIARFTSHSNVGQLYTYDPTSNTLLVWGAGAVLTTGVVADTVDFKAEFIKNSF